MGRTSENQPQKASGATCVLKNKNLENSNLPKKIALLLN
jgi:hypothetical protein